MSGDNLLFRANKTKLKYKMFRNRQEAGERLAEALIRYKNDENAVVVAIPRGGVVTGYVIAKALNLPLELALVKKIGHPSNPEYAIGAVSLKSHTLETNVNVNSKFIKDEIDTIRQLLTKRTELFYGKQEPMSLFRKTIILVDDGVATGNTLLASVDLIRQEKPEQIIVAVPVGPSDTIDEIKQFVDSVVCLGTPADFYAIGKFYDDFKQVSDEEAISLFKEIHPDYGIAAEK